MARVRKIPLFCKQMEKYTESYNQDSNLDTLNDFNRFKAIQVKFFKDLQDLVAEHPSIAGDAIMALAKGSDKAAVDAIANIAEQHPEFRLYAIDAIRQVGLNIIEKREPRLLCNHNFKDPVSNSEPTSEGLDASYIPVMSAANKVVQSLVRDFTGENAVEYIAAMVNEGVPGTKDKYDETPLYPLLMKPFNQSFKIGVIGEESLVKASKAVDHAFVKYNERLGFKSTF